MPEGLLSVLTHRGGGGGDPSPTATVSSAPTASFQRQLQVQRFCNHRLLLPNRFPNCGHPVSQAAAALPLASISFKRRSGGGGGGIRGSGRLCRVHATLLGRLARVAGALLPCVQHRQRLRPPPRACFRVPCCSRVPGRRAGRGARG